MQCLQREAFLRVASRRILETVLVNHDMNICIQIFTTDRRRSALNILYALGGIADDISVLRAVWMGHDGDRITSSIKSVLGSINTDESKSLNQKRDVFNECYVPFPTRSLRGDWKSLSCSEVIVHLSVSPESELWASSNGFPPSGKPVKRSVIAYVQSLERAAVHRKDASIPTVLEITLKLPIGEIDVLKNAALNYLTSIWPLVEISPKFAVVDLGGEWLFVPKSGYNPNTSRLHCYFSVDAIRAWPEWRQLHNISFDAFDSRPLAHSSLLCQPG